MHARSERAKKRGTINIAQFETDITKVQAIQACHESPNSLLTLHNVWTIHICVTILQLMNDYVADNGDKHVAVKTMGEFPNSIRSTHNANFVRDVLL